MYFTNIAIAIMKQKIQDILTEIVEQFKKNNLIPQDATVRVMIENTKDKKNGDYATNLAMLLAKPMKKKPQAQWGPEGSTCLCPPPRGRSGGPALFSTWLLAPCRYLLPGDLQVKRELTLAEPERDKVAAGAL